MIPYHFQGTIATYLDMKAVLVLEHFSDHGSIHQKMKKNTTSVRSYPNSAGDGKTPYEEGLVFHETAARQFPGSTWSST
ncbi:hypothetical protein TNCV_1915211 [Trichonephila clavipes]|uniref:Uncharacterized protein n=1 Tax=Trichonephila clavipes TaxID=2585209 RepID=A0A8X7BB93_TRICX|nr:hypothetical protein TNCV_1915211 [Trichonephila clavipes]